MGTTQHKTIRGPVMLEEIHSSGRCTGQSGNKHVYMEEGIPGETVTFTMERRKQGFYGGRIEDITEPSPWRIAPFCMHYHDCGGCNWQHIDYSHQLELKHRILCMALEKYAIITPHVPEVIASPEIRFFRHRMEYTFTRSGYYQGHQNPLPALGFHKPGEPGKITPIQECYLQAEPARAICEFTEDFANDNGMKFYDHESKTGFLRSLSVRVNLNGEAMVLLGLAEDEPVQREILLTALLEKFPQIVSLNYTFHISHNHSQLQGKIKSFDPTHPFMYITIAGYRFRIHASSFFQPNIQQAERIFLTVRDWANTNTHEKAYDLYTGVGTLAVFLAAGAGQVTGIEGSSFAAEDATENARINNLHNTAFLTGDILDTFKPSFLKTHGRPDLIVLDPPRSGTLIEIKKTINSSGADRVIYLSCNPVSLAYDLKQLTEKYHVARIQPFDMVPHTHHLETLVMMEHK